MSSRIEIESRILETVRRARPIEEGSRVPTLEFSPDQVEQGKMGTPENTIVVERDSAATLGKGVGVIAYIIRQGGAADHIKP